MADRHWFTAAELLRQLPGPDGRAVRGRPRARQPQHRASTRRGGRDPQQPHTRDEVCVGRLGPRRVRERSARHAFAPGDLLFVPAGIEHRFEQFTDDLAVWVVFYGPEGGDAA